MKRKYKIFTSIVDSAFVDRVRSDLRARTAHETFKTDYSLVKNEFASDKKQSGLTIDQFKNLKKRDRVSPT